MIILLKIGFANENWLIFSMGDPPGESVYHGVMATENPLVMTIHGLDQA